MAVSKHQELRLLVVGKTGQGKSSTCNAIIGHNLFKVSPSSSSTTDTCSWHKERNRFGMTIEVVDTPGFYDTDHSNSKVHKELIKCLLLTTPGFHAIAFVLMMGKFTQEMQKTKDLFFKWFGPGVEKFSFVIITDTNSKGELDNYLQDKPHPELTKLIKQCGERVVPLQSKCSNEQSRTEQISGILQMVGNIKAMNNNECFSNVLYTLAKSYAEEKNGRVTHESMRLLTEAGLDPSKLTTVQRDCLSNTIEKGYIPGNRTSSKDEQKSRSVTENVSAAQRPRGNLKIFDNTTMRPLHDTDTASGKLDYCTANNEFIGTNQSNTRTCDDIGNTESKPSSRARYKIDPNSFETTPSSAQQSFAYKREPPLSADHNRTSANTDSDAPDSTELMKNNVNNENDNQEINGFIAFIRKWIPSRCNIL